MPQAGRGLQQVDHDGIFEVVVSNSERTMQLIIFFMIISCISIYGQDTLITTSGMIYTGNLNEISDERVIFTETGKSQTQSIPLYIIGKIISEEGTVNVNEITPHSARVAKPEDSMGESNQAQEPTISGFSLSPFEIVQVAITNQRMKRARRKRSKITFASAKLYSQDTLTTSAGQKYIGNITKISENSIQFMIDGTDLLEFSNKIVRSISGGRWILILDRESMCTGQLAGVKSDTLFLKVEDGSVEGYKLENIAIALNYQASDQGGAFGTATGILLGGIAASIPIILDSYSVDEYDTRLEHNAVLIAAPLGLFGGGILGNKMGKKWYNLKSVYWLESEINQAEYKQGRKDGRKASWGNIMWFIPGAMMNYYGPSEARKYKPFPPPDRLIGKSHSYIAGFIEGYGKKASTLNTFYSSVGCLGNCWFVPVGIIILGSMTFSFDSPWAN